MAISIYNKKSAVAIADNFNSNEFDCHGVNCCNETYIDSELVDILQEIRTHFGKAVIINSAYRCATHNANVGGASKSKHRSGMAADIVVKDVEPKEVAKYAESIGVKGIGLYETTKDGYFVHIDTRANKSFWYGQAQEPRSTFGGSTPETVATKVNAKVKEFQEAAIADGFGKLLPSGADGIWGKECEAVAKVAICKKRLTYKYKNLTKFVQRAVGVTADGKYGNDTKQAVINWQKLVKLTADGEAGCNTYKKICGV